MTKGYEALRHGVARLDLSARGRFRVTGRDRVRLLHNVTSNEIKKLSPGSGCYAFLLTPQGRIQADLNLFCFADHFLIDTEPELREKVPQSILKYKVADQVELEDITERTWAVGVEGPDAERLFASENVPVPGEPYAHVAWGECIVANISVTGQSGFRIFGHVDRKPGFLDEAIPLASKADVREVRVENGRPRFGEDIRETMLPQETQQMHAVSFLKGCYIGQEIVERIRAQGHVNKKMVRVRIDANEALPAGTKLAAEGKEVGEITSSVYAPEAGGVAALAYVRVPYTEAGTALDIGGVGARIV
jgi:tRNA-modifying protein YgfZ